ncbi:PD-(D/E)XK nuclease family protein [Nocardia sp. NPDC003979]
MDVIRSPAVALLAADPLYQLATAGQELFHTNMLYWLIQNAPDAASPLLREVFGILAPQSDVYSTTVEREYRHWDLFVDSGMGCGKLVVENKLHSLPHADQLSDYYEKAPQRLRTDEVVYALLSLIRPTFALPSPWRYVDYSELVAPLNVAAEILRESGRGFDADLIERYSRLITLLLTVRDDYDVAHDMDQPVLLPPPCRQALDAARVLPLVEKLRISGLSTLIAAEVGSEVGVGVGFSNTHGKVEFSTEGLSKHRFGWQYQGGQLRISVVLSDTAGGPWKGRRTAREHLVQKNFGDYFDFEVVTDADHRLGQYSGRNLPWLGYEPDFVYRYRPIQPHTSYVELAEMCTRLTYHAREYAATH